MNEHHHDDNRHEKIEKMVTMTVSATKGIAPMAQVLLPLAQITRGTLAPPEVRDFAKALMRILQGEREPEVLMTGLSAEFAEAIQETLRQIAAPLPELDDEERIGLTFEQLIEKVAEACTGEILLWQQLWIFTGELMADEMLSVDIRALAAVLRKILAGERQAHILEELSLDHRWAVEQLLDWLNKQAVSPAG